MYTIVKKIEIAESIFQYKFKAPEIAKKFKPGQFLILRGFENGERLPFTITEKENDTISVIFQIAGKSTKRLSTLEEGDSFLDVLGPLGHSAEIKNIGTVAMIGGGVGTAVLFPEIKACKEAGNKVISIIGFRSKNQIILEEEVKKYSDELIVTTDDGSYGEKGVVTGPLEEIMKRETINRAVAIGPIIMMKFTSELTRKYNVPTTVSLNPIMVDGTGMCGTCRVEVDGKTMFACVDGPEFDGHKVNFDMLIKRNLRYSDKEKEANEIG